MDFVNEGAIKQLQSLMDEEDDSLKQTFQVIKYVWREPFESGCLIVISFIFIAFWCALLSSDLFYWCALLSADWCAPLQSHKKLPRVFSVFSFPGCSKKEFGEAEILEEIKSEMKDVIILLMYIGRNLTVLIKICLGTLMPILK